MKIAHCFFKYRSYTPIPLVLLLLYQAHPGLPWIVPGFGLLFLGEAIRFWAVRHAGGATRTREVGAPSLVTSGPYGYVRNPLYLGNMFIYAGIVFIASGPWMWELFLIAIIFFTIQYLLIISLEETTLEEMFGEHYESYRKHVGRFIPGLRPWGNTVRPSREHFSIRETLKPEKSTLMNMAMVLILLGGKWLYLHL
ncbi:MAG TPA: isoprenylcysteine carboxylmethyltransferase family protein [bacterium]|nr:isoprenylcysteine carboxylmethyltransferase family protein [bacterium]